MSNSHVRVIKVCIVRLVHIYLNNIRQLFDKYAVVRTEHDALVKSMTKIFKFCGLLITQTLLKQILAKYQKKIKLIEAPFLLIVKRGNHVFIIV